MTENYICPNVTIKLVIVFHQGIRNLMKDLGVNSTNYMHHVPESPWDKITAGLKFVQCQKLQCALKLLKKTEEYTFLGQPIPINNNNEI